MHYLITYHYFDQYPRWGNLNIQTTMEVTEDDIDLLRDEVRRANGLDAETTVVIVAINPVGPPRENDSENSPWSREDPREQVARRYSIVVMAIDRLMFGEVDTKQGYCVILRHQDPDFRKLIGENDEWPVGWWWIAAPT